VEPQEIGLTLPVQLKMPLLQTLVIEEALKDDR
jgi:hypothetical protein